MKLKSITAIFIFASSLCFPQAGTLDNTFGTNGVVTKAVGTCTANYGLEIVIKPDDKIALVAEHYFPGYSSLLGFNSDGSNDNTFGASGTVTTNLSTHPRTVLRRPDGKLIIARNGFSIVQFLPNGNVDTDFGTNGIATTLVDTGGYDITFCLALQADGKVLLGGYTILDSIGNITLVRFNSNGIIDNSFGVNGVVITTFGNQEFPNPYCGGLLYQSDGKIVAACTFGNINPPRGLIRYNTNGTIDSSFGNNGIVANVTGKLLQQPDGKLITVTTSTVAHNFLITRLNSDGSFDNSFGTNGQKSLLAGQVSAACLQPDGKILAAGHAGGPHTGSVSIARFNSDGSVDNTFGNNGVTFTKILDRADYASSIGMQSDGKIIIGGHSSQPDYSTYIVLARYHSGLVIDINEHEKTDELQIFPNPAKNKLHLKNDTGLEKDEIIITNQLGQEVLSIPYSNEIDISALAKGIYFLSIKGSDKKGYKFIKE